MALGLPAPCRAPLLVVTDLLAELFELPRRDVVRQDPPGETAVHRFQPVVAHRPRSPAGTSPSSIVPPRYSARICGFARISAPVPSSRTRPASITTPWS